MLLELKIEAIPISVDGHDYYAVPKAVLDAMFRVQAPAPPPMKRGPKPKAAKVPAPKSTPAAPPTQKTAPSIGRADAVREALKGGPRDVEQVLEAVRAQGRDDDRQQVGTTLVQLRMAGDTAKDQDGKWRLTE